MEGIFVRTPMMLIFLQRAAHAQDGLAAVSPQTISLAIMES